MAEAGPGSRRLFKVWSADRRFRKAVMATTLAELIDVGCTKLGYTHQIHQSEIRVVLEADGTDVEDESTFGSLVRDTVLLLMLPGEAWLPPSVEAIKTGPGLAGIILRPPPSDAVDASVSGSMVRPEPPGEFVARTLKGVNGTDLLSILVEDVGRIVLLSEEQLEAVGNLREVPADLPGLLGKHLIEACDQMLLEKQDCREALATIDLLKRNAFATRTPAAADEVDQNAQKLPLTIDQSTQTCELPVLEQILAAAGTSNPPEEKRRRTEGEPTDECQL